MLFIMECLTKNCGLGTLDGRNSSLDWKIVKHPYKGEYNIYCEKICNLVEEKDISDSSSSLLNDYDSEFNIWDVLICTG